MYIIQPIIWIQLLWRNRRTPSYYFQNLLERYGFYNNSTIKSNNNNIILHAVSLGETLAAIPLIQALQKKYPEITIILTSMTSTGIKLAQSKFVNHHNIYCSYLPYDLPGAMKRFINHIQPKLVITIETELWPNLINILYKQKTPFIIANARLSLRSFINYKKITHFMSLLMKRITLIAAQNENEASRFIKLGFKKNQLFVTGNLKYDITINQELIKKISYLKKTWGKNRKIWIASSTHPGEENILLKAHKKLLTIFPNLLMILAPRHPNRFKTIEKITKKTGLSYIIKNNKKKPSASTQVIIINTIGELMLLYGVSNIAFIGGSLVKHGGHNPLEPAAHAIPLIMGPYTHNFHDICNKLNKAHGLITITGITSLIKEISKLLTNPKYCLKYGQHAIKVLQNNQGTIQKLLKILDKYLPTQKNIHNSSLPHS